MRAECEKIIINEQQSAANYAKLATAAAAAALMAQAAIWLKRKANECRPRVELSLVLLVREQKRI